MFRFQLLCVAIALSGVFAQFDETEDNPTGLSASCEAGLMTVERTTEYTLARAQYYAFFDLMCTSVTLTTEFDDLTPYEITPCIMGLDFIEEACGNLGGYVCELDIYQTITNVSNGEVQTAIVQLGQCLPGDCSTDDYDTLVEYRVTTVRDLLEADYPSPDYEVEVTGSVMCYDGGLPALFGEGYQTYIVMSGEQPAEDTSFEIYCETGCDPEWAVTAEIPSLYTGTEISNYMAALLNADENFSEAGCLAKFAELRGNADLYGDSVQSLNIFCPDMAAIYIAENGGTSSLITDFTSMDGLTMMGAQSSFDSTAISIDAGSGASAVAPAAIVALAAIAAAVAAQ